MSIPLPPLLLRGDCLAELARIPDESIDAVVTDPPYGLANTDPAHVVEALTRWAQGDRDFIPSGRGFMGKEWDAFVPPPAVWDECARILKPGGHLLAFAGSRTFDLMTLSIRFAGFEIRDSIAWLHSQGFPKSMDVSKAIDKSGGNAHLARPIAVAIKAARLAHGWTIGRADAEFCGGSTLYSWYEGRPKGIQTPTSTTFALMVEAWPELAPYAAAVAEVEREVTGSHKSSIVVGTSGPTRSGEGKERHDLPATDAAREWEGWGTALKPAFEPVVVARKPLIGTVAANVLEHGTGALNIDATRIGVSDAAYARNHSGDRGHAGTRSEDRSTDIHAGGGSASNLGRWPANVVLDESQAAALDAQSGTKMSRGHTPKSRKGAATDAVYALGHSGQDDATESHAEESGGASRFFFVARREGDTIETCESATTVDASSSPRNEHGASARDDAATSAHLEAQSTRVASKAPSTSGTRKKSKKRADIDTPMTPNTDAAYSREPLHEKLTPSSDRAPSAASSESGTTKTTTDRSTSSGTADPTTFNGTSSFMDPGAPGSRFLYSPKAPKSERPVVDGTAHPTVKPLALMRWLLRLVTPPGGCVVDPFAGSGTTLEAAYLEGFESIGVEMTPEYWPLIAARIERVTK